MFNGVEQKDHDVLRDYYQQYKKASNDEDRQKWANVYLMHNAVHAVRSRASDRLLHAKRSAQMAEELVIYPVMCVFFPPAFGGAHCCTGTRSD